MGKIWLLFQIINNQFKQLPKLKLLKTYALKRSVFLKQAQYITKMQTHFIAQIAKTFKFLTVMANMHKINIEKFRTEFIKKLIVSDCNKLLGKNTWNKCIKIYPMKLLFKVKYNETKTYTVGNRIYFTRSNKIILIWDCNYI